MPETQGLLSVFWGKEQLCSAGEDQKVHAESMAEMAFPEKQ